MENIQARIANNVNIIQNLKKTRRESNNPITAGEKRLILILYQENTHLSQELLDKEKDVIMSKKESNFLEHITTYGHYKACVKEIKENNEQSKMFNLLKEIQANNNFRIKNNSPDGKNMTKKAYRITWISLLSIFVGLLIYSEALVVVIYIKTITSILSGVPWW